MSYHQNAGQNQDMKISNKNFKHFLNLNYCRMLAAIHSRIIPHPIKNVKIKILLNIN
jgi:hypothetical protein